MKYMKFGRFFMLKEAASAQKRKKRERADDKEKLRPLKRGKSVKERMAKRSCVRLREEKA